MNTVSKQLNSDMLYKSTSPESLKTIKYALCQAIDDLKPAFEQIANYLHANPELGNEEFKASALLKDILSTNGFTLQPAAPEEFPTSFQASCGTGPLHIGFLAEYDALPELGHACGHNLIAAMSTIAAIACASIPRLTQAATVHLFGCPAEETLGSKVRMSELGLFDNLSAALICHPSDVTSFGGTSYATHPLQVTFIGKPAHVADPDYHGINALDALVDFYTRLNALQQTFTEPYIVGKIITEGGVAPNIVPERATLRATIRALRVEYLEAVMLPTIKNLAQQVSSEHDTKLDMFHYEPLYKNLINDKTIENYMAVNYRILGLKDEDILRYPDDDADGSTDVGNVSHACPTIQTEIKIGSGIAAHTPEFAAAAGSAYGKEMSLLACKAMAMTAADIGFINQIEF